MTLILPEPEKHFWWCDDPVIYDGVKDFTSILLRAKKCAVYWSPSKSRPVFRSLTTKREGNALPPDAELVGVFTHPCPREVFAEALRETISEHKSQQVAA